MPRKSKDEAMNEYENIEAEAPEAEAPEATESTVDSRFVMIQDPVSGETVKRVDWIRSVFQEEGGEFYGDRGKIARKLTEIQGKKVPYQIVFAATKDLKHIKKPEAPAEEGEGEGEGAEA